MALPDIKCYENHSANSASKRTSIIGQLLAKENQLLDSDSEIPFCYCHNCSIETRKHNLHNDALDSSTVVDEDCKSIGSPEDRILSFLAIYKTPRSQRRKTPRQKKKKQQEKSTSESSFLSSKDDKRQIPELIKKWPSCVDVWLNMLYKEEASLRSRHTRNVVNKINNILLPRMRAILAAWVMEVCDVYQLRRSTYYLTLDYIDRYLINKTYVEKAQLQLLGITCLFIASKLEEIYPPSLTEFAYVCNNSCTTEEIIVCERVVLHVLAWDVNPMTPTTWLNLYMQIDSMPADVSDQLRQQKVNLATFSANCSPVDRALYFPTYSGYKFVRASHIIDLFSLDPAYAHFSYNVIAATAMRFIVGDAAARAASGLAPEQMELCVAHMSFFYDVVTNTDNPRMLSVLGNGSGGACTTGIPPTACLPTGDLYSPAAFLVNTINDNQVASYRAIRASIPNLVPDENHTMQNHCIGLNDYEHAVLLRLIRLGFKIEKKYSKHEKPVKQTAVPVEPVTNSTSVTCAPLESNGDNTTESKSEEEDLESEEDKSEASDGEQTTKYSTYQLERTCNVNKNKNVAKLGAKVDIAIQTVGTVPTVIDNDVQVITENNEVEDYSVFDLDSLDLQFVNFDAILSNLYGYCSDELILSMWRESKSSSVG